MRGWGRRDRRAGLAFEGVAFPERDDQGEGGGVQALVAFGGLRAAFRLRGDRRLPGGAPDRLGAGLRVCHGFAPAVVSPLTLQK